MRIRVGHDAWLDVGPGVGRSSGHGGSLVIGDPTPSSKHGVAKRTAEARAAARLRDEERSASPGCQVTGNCHHPPCTTLRAREVRLRYDAGGITYTELGRQFGRDRSTIKYLLRIADRPA